MLIPPSKVISIEPTAEGKANAASPSAFVEPYLPGGGHVYRYLLNKRVQGRTEGSY